MSTIYLRDLVEVNGNAEMRSAVQLSSFRRPENLALLRSYLFTDRSAGRKKSSAELLRLFCDAFVDGRMENRFVVVATYGHGKSHFALAVANYFGKAFNTQEAATLLEGLDHALSERGLYGRLVDFRKNHGPYLVLTMRGDEPLDLPTMFFRALTEALAADPRTSEIELPFWFKQAQQFLEDLSGARREQAEAVLQGLGLDLATLLHQVRQSESRAQAPFRALFRELNSGVEPNFAVQTPLGDAVQWIISELCGRRGLFEGLLVLFDEFSAFIERYPQMRREISGQPLFDLLEGIERHREKAVFVAFSQHDPDSIAETVTKYEPEQTLSNIQKELNRLPLSQRYLLHSSLEAVLDSFLRQEDAIWDRLRQNARFNNAILHATHDTMILFGKHYEQELGWNRARVQEVVVKGCFPLHPLTTTLLAAVDLHKTNSPRTVLGFVRDVVDERLNQPVLRGDQPAWVLPIELVDYFEDMLGQEYDLLYRSAYRKAGGADTPPEQVAVLKALLLRVIANIGVTGTALTFERLIAALAGLTPEQASAALEQLARRGLIRHDSFQGIYTFWEGGRDAGDAERALARKLEQFTLDGRTVNQLTERLKDYGLEPQAIAVPWGHQQDWAATPLLVSRRMLTVEYLKMLEATQLRGDLGSRDRQRGLILWSLTANEDDLGWYRAEVRNLLQQAFGDRTVPVVVMVPQQPAPHLIEALLKLHALHEFTTKERRDVGEEQFTWMRDAVARDVRTALQHLLTNADPYVPSAFRARLEAIQTRSLDRVLSEVYQMAYSQGPGIFYDHYQLSTIRLSKAVSLVYTLLLENGLHHEKTVNTNPIAKDIVNKFLKQHWGIVGDDGRVREPARNSRLRWGWAALDETFHPGGFSMQVAPVFVKLLSPPFGYDWNTLALLFSAWYGRYHHELEVSQHGRILGSLIELAKKSNGDLKSPKDFLTDLEHVRLKRRDRSEDEQRVHHILRRLQNRETFTNGEAQEAIRQVQYVAADEYYDPTLRQQAKDAAERLDADRQAAQTYDQRAAELAKSAERNGLTVPTLCQAYAEIAELRPPTYVKPESPDQDMLRQSLRNTIEKRVKDDCARYGRLAAIENYASHRNTLQEINKALQQQGFDYLAHNVTTALDQLDAEKKRLDSEQRDKATLAQIASIPVKGRLVDLRRNLARLERMTFYSAEGEQARDIKAAHLRAEIDRLQGVLPDAASRLDQATNLREVQATREMLIERRELLAESEFQAKLDTALERCNVVGNYLRDLELLQRRQFETPEALEAAQSQLARLREATPDGLTEIHRKLADQVSLRLQRIAEQKRDEALAWLERCKQSVQDSQHLTELAATLQRPPAFLPAEARSELETLRQQVRQRLDADVALQVIALFRKISDPDKRRACLAQLQRLVEEEAYGLSMPAAR